ncbi:FAD-binding oxidoreductase [Desertimonas flava]|uniref:FAD-binding oxidoreductase n=1 Tax=Desertimonas flava TaxID=2064846 RepID=UPI0018782E11|nr:FAD-binding oxidoreductase [Desertimonas flava]
MPHASLLDDLAGIVGGEHVLTDADLRAGYETDWTRRYHGEALAVVRPGDAEQTAAVLARCAADGVPVVPQGGNTGMVGASVPRGNGMVVLSMRRLDHVGEVNAAGGQVSLGAGVTIARWREVARAAGLDSPVDFGARDSATVGGATATNAGGSRVVRFGTMRSQVMGVVAALSTGATVGSLAGLPKETVGLHWPSLLAGSEGTLGVITAVRLRLVPWYRQHAAALVALPLPVAVELLSVARRQLPHLDAAELLMADAMDVAAAHLGRTPPVHADQAAGVDTFVLLECADHDDPTAELAEALAAVGGIADSAMASDPAGIARLVEFRDRMAESISTLGVPLKLDVATQPGRLPELIALAERAASSRGCHLVPFGHLAEGNVHVNLLGEPLGPGRYAPVDPALADGLAEEILTGVAGLGGTISAEHGVGIAKAKWLPLVRRADELAAAAAVKAALDPSGILNPGVLTP